MFYLLRNYAELNEEQELQQSNSTQKEEEETLQQRNIHTFTV